MSQVLNRVVKPLVCKKFPTHNNKKFVRWCSSMPIYPYMLLDTILTLVDSGKDSSDGRIARREYSFGQTHVVIKDIELLEEVRNAMSFLNGAFEYCRLRRTLHTPKNDMCVYINKQLKFLYLPPLPRATVIQNIAMTDDVEKEDWVLAIKLYGSQIKLYRPDGRQWINVKAIPQSTNTFSSITYSKKDGRFYVPTPGSGYLYALDPNSKENDHPEFIGLWTEHVPKRSILHQLEETKWFTKTVHFVEAPSGEQFIVKWCFMDEYEIYKGLRQVTSRTRQFVVFRAEDHPLEKKKKKLIYTKDIGDLCIFLGHGEPFCVPASMHPGLRPNCIYFAGYNFGVFDITAIHCYLFYAEEGILGCTEFPYWPNPS